MTLRKPLDHGITGCPTFQSYTEEDLKLSVERSIWASQSHNEPILDQAFRTSPDGVYLIFSANRSGEFFGYARMTGPIWRPSRRASAPSSPVSRPSLTTRRASLSGSLGKPSYADPPGVLLPAFECRLTTASPRPISPSDRLGPPPPTQVTNARSLPEPVRNRPDPKARPAAPAETQESGGSDDEAASEMAANGRPFEVNWITVRKLPFHLTRDLKNPFKLSYSCPS